MKIERNHLIILFLILLGLALFRTFGGNIFHAGYAPDTITITPTLSNNMYVASVTWIDFKPNRWCGGDFYPHRFKLQGIHPEYLKDNYCYLNVSRIESYGCYGATCSWFIKAASGDIVFRAPLENGICDFNTKGEIVNINQVNYTIVCTTSRGTTENTYNCSNYKDWCWGKITIESSGVSGKLYLLLKEGSLGSCPPTGGYCTSDKTFEVRNYYCEQGYGTVDKCFVGHCKYNVVYKGECGFLENCVNGKCIITQETKTKIMLGAIVGIAFIVLLIIWVRRK